MGCFFAVVTHLCGANADVCLIVQKVRGIEGIVNNAL